MVCTSPAKRVLQFETPRKCKTQGAEAALSPSTPKKKPPVKPWPKRCPKPSNFGGRQDRAGVCRACKASRDRSQRGSICERCLKGCRQMFGHQRFQSLTPEQVQQVVNAVVQLRGQAKPDPRPRPCRSCAQLTEVLGKVEKLVEQLPLLEALVTRLEQLEGLKTVV